MTDAQLINHIAHIWVANGGDAEGIDWTWRLIRDRVAEIILEDAPEKP